jgi:signal transduction histidine kinase
MEYLERMSTRAPGRGRLAEEQAALRRVATLVASGASSTEVFDAVAQEVAQVLHLTNTAICRYDEEGRAMSVLATWGERPETFRPGTRWPLDGPSMSREVLRTGRPVRVEDYTNLSGSLAAEAREHGFDRVAGAPIIVDGRVWGVISTSSLDAPLPDDLEDRLAEFTELLATAISNSQAHEELARLAEEQAALRRVATLVAQGAPPTEVFEAVSTEVAQLVPADGSALTRFEPDGTVTAVGGWSSGGGYVYVGKTYALEGTVSGLVFDSGRPERVDSYADAPGTAAVAAREMGWRSSVGAPITLGGRLWGVLAVISTSDRPLPADTERRLTQFTELVATAIANAQGHEELAVLAEEQSALRRVATLVAEGALPDDVFAAVGTEVARTLGVPVALLFRYDTDGMASILATSGDEFGAVGTRLPIPSRSIVSTVYETGRAARIDDWERLSGPEADFARERGLRWGVGVPIVVDGALWGVMATASREGESRAREIEPRLTKFTELLATAIANTEGREALRVRSEEQAALHRIATLVARGVPSPEVLAAVAKEVRRVLDADWAAVHRLDSNGTATILSFDGNMSPEIPVGTSEKLDPQSLVARILRTGRSARVENYESVSGDWAAIARELGVRSAVGAPIIVEGRPWGVMVATWSREGAVPVIDVEDRLANFTELVATAIANAESRAELDASRARIVTTADATRRRIERDLHDGAQQQLLSLALEVRAAQAGVPRELVEHRADLDHVAERLTDVLDGLREIALGLHPAILAEGGLGPALKILAHRSPVAVELEVALAGRLPEQVEVAAYYVVSEALTNAAKHARATLVRVSVDIREGVLQVLVNDDGIGGAAPLEGSGLLGLKDRAEALGGTVCVVSPPGEGTSLTAKLPLER